MEDIIEEKPLTNLESLEMLPELGKSSCHKMCEVWGISDKFPGIRHS